jgi:hypothetical protein
MMRPRQAGSHPAKFTRKHNRRKECMTQEKHIDELRVIRDALLDDLAKMAAKRMESPPTFILSRREQLPSDLERYADALAELDDAIRYVSRTFEAIAANRCPACGEDDPMATHDGYTDDLHLDYDLRAAAADADDDDLDNHPQEGNEA